MMLRNRGGIILTLALVAVVCMLGLGAGDARGALTDPPYPATTTETGDPQLDENIYYGAIPPGGDSAPVLVFVHGMGRTALDWWTETPYDGVNDMYAAAYEAGYRTAFVNLDYPPDEPPHSIWTNGARLAAQLEAIVAHYDVRRVDLITHSKGGVDAQVAIAYEGAWRRVHHVFNLAPPHHGSELADLIHSPVAQGLAQALGLINDATDCLQTSVMADFRAMTDPRLVNQLVSYHPAAGTSHGPPHSLISFTGLYLAQFGANDGLVTVASTSLSGADELFVQPYHHFNIHTGHTAFPWIQAELGGLPDPFQAYLPFVSAVKEAPEEETSLSLTALRGGDLAEPVTQTLVIRDPDVRKAYFVLLTSHETVTPTLAGPDGLPRSLTRVPEGLGGVLGDAVVWTHVAEEPLGRWTLNLEGPPDGAYLLLVLVESPLDVAMQILSKGRLLPSEQLTLMATASDRAGGAEVRQVEASVVRYAAGHRGEELRIQPQPGSELAWTPPDDGMYVMDVVVRGKTGAGTPFERAFVRSLLVGEEVEVCQRPQSSGR